MLYRYLFYFKSTNITTNTNTNINGNVKMKKRTIKFKDLFELFSISQENDTVHQTKKDIYVKTPNGKLVKIEGLIRKSNQTMYEIKCINGITHKGADGHLIKTESGFKKIKNINIKTDKLLNYKKKPLKIDSITKYAENSYAYDISIKSPHEYITPNGLIHHNSTLARIIRDELISNQEMDLMEMNGSDQTGVDVVRNDITGFLQSPPYAAKHKIVYIDEFDYTSTSYQACCRGVFEKYHETGRFVCTGNYKSKIIDPLLSRFQVIEMKKLSEEYVSDFCFKILEKENIKYKKDDIKLLVQAVSPDVRKIINTMQQSVINGKIEGIDKDSIVSIEKKVIGLICDICDNIGKSTSNSVVNKNMNIINKICIEKEIDYLSVYQILFESDVPMWAKISINKHCNSHNSCAIPHIHFIAMCWDIIQNGIQFTQLLS